jgi:hypothetical protein
MYKYPKVYRCGYLRRARNVERFIFSTEVITVVKYLLRDNVWRIATPRRRILLRAEVFAQVAETHAYLLSLAETFRLLHAHLLKRWDGEVAKLPYYPAFRL